MQVLMSNDGRILSVKDQKFTQVELDQISEKFPLDDIKSYVINGISHHDILSMKIRPILLGNEILDLRITNGVDSEEDMLEAHPELLQYFNFVIAGIATALYSFDREWVYSPSRNHYYQYIEGFGKDLLAWFEVKKGLIGLATKEELKSVLQETLLEGISWDKAIFDKTNQFDENDYKDYVDPEEQATAEKLNRLIYFKKEIDLYDLADLSAVDNQVINNISILVDTLNENLPKEEIFKSAMVNGLVLIQANIINLPEDTFTFESLVDEYLSFARELLGPLDALKVAKVNLIALESFLDAFDIDEKVIYSITKNWVKGIALGNWDEFDAFIKSVEINNLELVVKLQDSLDDKYRLILADVLEDNIQEIVNKYLGEDEVDANVSTVTD